MPSIDVARLSMAAGSSRGDVPGYVSIGRIGHEVPGPSYMQVREGQIYVEVTIEPDGDEIMARVGQGIAGPDSVDFKPLEFGCRVLVEFPEGEADLGAVITGRLSDALCALPTTVCGVPFSIPPTPGSQAPAPGWVAMRAPLGSMMGIETQAGGDMLLHSGASSEFRALTSAILSAPLVFLGPNQSFTTPPTGAQAGPNSFVPGTPAVPPVPVTAPNAGGFPGLTQGVLRFSDTMQSNITADPLFWTWITLLQTWVLAVHALPTVGPILASAGIGPPVPPPISLTSVPVTSSTGVLAS